ncbi:hypothetical protein [Pseudomonas fluorescens]|uniref:Prophage PssSM-03 n=1 Tax=Pseudomonas fluorescens TaxID=294 RepID=A0A5E7RQ61_PSEFL|nr:hypothetical protein [Pseudomonas fluorescens]VVP73083.1 hypothetical protein PS922_01020 [Pseudomonas fluorescens]
MKKPHGHGFRKAQIDLEHCSTCKGKAVVQGVFYELVCIDCNGSGWVASGSGEVLPLDFLVTQLSLKLQHAQQLIASMQRPGTGPQAQYEQNNRRGTGGTNYTGD